LLLWLMLIYYRGSGINADLALILNLVILLGVLGLSSACREAQCAYLDVCGNRGSLLTLVWGRGLTC